jgi:hypothetical protein
MGGDSASLISPSRGLFIASRHGFPIVGALNQQILIETPLSGGRAAFRCVPAASHRAGDF